MRRSSREYVFKLVFEYTFYGAENASTLEFFLADADLTDEEIDYYIERYRPFDKARAYGVQEWIGYIGIDSITGSFYTIVGFPVFMVYRHLKDFLQDK